MLGPLEAVESGATIPLGGPRQRALLTLLMLDANRVVSRARLIDGLWGDEPPAAAANSLQVAVHGLRKQLGADRIETAEPGYALRVAPGELDLDRFERLVERARAETPAQAAATLAEALALWRGEPLTDLPDGAAERRRLEEARLAAVEQRIDADLALGRHAELIGELELLIAEHPYRELLRGQLMLALYRSGRQADALAAYQAARNALVEHLGIEPGERLRELERAMLRQDKALAPPRPASAGTSLPAPTTSLVGRTLERSAVTALLGRDDVRLLTLTGPGGTGKTRLALEAAAELEPDFPDGVVFVDLAPIDDPALVPGTVARALDLGESDVPTVEQLKRALGLRTTLLVLDNFEQVVDAALLVSQLLAAAADLKVLVTSRIVLHISGEHEYPVPPLRVPGGEARSQEELARNEAVALFVARAQAVSADFRLSPENVEDVAAICVSLDGLPLALELAAARIGLLAPSALRERLGRRLEILAGGPRDFPERHQALRGTIDWSYELLDPDGRELFARLAVFAGGCTIEAAEQVCEATLETLQALVTNSLVQREAGARGEPRFRMLETVREYAVERLEARGEHSQLRRRHAAFFTALAEAVAEALWASVQGPDRVRRLDRLEADIDNLRAALAWGEQHEPATTLRIAAALADFWVDRRYQLEGLGWLERGLAADGTQAPEVRAKALHGASYLAFLQGAYEHGDELGTESLALYRALGDLEGEGRTLHILGWSSTHRGDLERAAALAGESLALARKLDHRRGVIVSLTALANTAAGMGDSKRAVPLFEEGLELARADGDRIGEAGVLGGWGALAADQGDDEMAGRMLAASLVLCHEEGHLRGVDGGLHSIAMLAQRNGRAEAAATLFAAAAELRDAIGSTVPLAERPASEAALAATRASLGEEAFTVAWERGRTLSQDEAVNLALAMAVREHTL